MPKIRLSPGQAAVIAAGAHAQPEQIREEARRFAQTRDIRRLQKGAKLRWIASRAKIRGQQPQTRQLDQRFGKRNAYTEKTATSRGTIEKRLMKLQALHRMLQQKHTAARTPELKRKFGARLLRVEQLRQYLEAAEPSFKLKRRIVP